MKTDITVIVPMYNVEKYVSKCLKSLLNQTYKNFEVWAVDDGSPDNSKEIVKEFADKDSRIKLIVKENGGYGSVLEYCIQRISTKYFLICDPDDWLREDALATLYSLASKNDLDLVVGDKYNVYIDSNNREYKKSVPDRINIVPNTVYKDKKYIQLFSFLDVSPHAKLYKTSLAKKITFPHKVSYTDFVLYMVFLSHVNKIMYINKPLAFYLLDRPGNTATDIQPKVVDDHIVVWDSVYKQLNGSYSILMFRLFEQLKFILKVYKKISYQKHSKIQLKKIQKSIQKLQAYKKQMEPISSVLSTNIGRIMYYGFMNHYLDKITIKIYLSLNRV